MTETLDTEYLGMRMMCPMTTDTRLSIGEAARLLGVTPQAVSKYAKALKRSTG